MTAVVSSILSGIKSIIVAELGSDYKELPFSLDVAKNRFAGGTKGYAAWANQINETAGVTGFVTVDHTFEVILTDTYGSSQVGDAPQRAIGETLFNRLDSIYSKVVAEKAGYASRVMNVSRLVTLPIQFLDSNVAVLRATFDIKYRTARGS